MSNAPQATWTALRSVCCCSLHERFVCDSTVFQRTAGDVDGDGALTADELRQVIRLFMIPLPMMARLAVLVAGRSPQAAGVLSGALLRCMRLSWMLLLPTLLLLLLLLRCCLGCAVQLLHASHVAPLIAEQRGLS